MRPGTRRLPHTLRHWSWVLGALALVLPVSLYIWRATEFTRWADAQSGYVCGMPLLGFMMQSLLLSGLLSGVAMVMGLVSFRRMPEPTVRRSLEVCVIGLPAMLVGIGVLGLAASLLF